MKSQQLPERPNLEQLKKQAKTLLRAAQANDPNVLQRFQSLPTLAKIISREGGGANLALHDAQFVIAREHSFKSWKELREHIEERMLDFAAALDEFVRCATGNAPARAYRLLDQFPALASASLESELVLGNSVAAIKRLHEHP